MKDNKEKLAVRRIAYIIFFAAAVILTYIVGIIYETKPLPMDISVQNFFFGLRNSVVDAVMIVITHLGDTTTIIALCAVLLILPSRKRYGLPVSAAALSGVAVYKPMKHIFLRARPDVAFHLVEQGGYSFPSGHSVTSVIVYGLLFYLIMKKCDNEKLKNVLSGVCLALALLIGPSRIYVGVHWPTDVLAGWCIGGMVLLITINILERIERKNENVQ